jgi:hypothetical protein
MAEVSLDPRIRIRAPLRCDGIGRLDCAEDAESGGRLAVRWLPLEANGDAAVKACARLPEHPMLPRIRQTGQVGTSAFVAMDFPEGALLSTRSGERFEADWVIRLGAQLSSALATVHAQGVVHGEMSTDSVLLVEPDAAYLWDMPLVIANRLTDRRGENRLMQNLVKTAPFLAPERARGEGASQASDVYALGAVLCVAAGAPLPVAPTTLGVVHQVASGAFSPRVPMVLPEPHRSTLAQMVAADPAQRPSSAEVAAVFAVMPAPAMLPTVPEFPVVKLPPELLAAADVLLRRPSRKTHPVPADPARSRENQIPADAALGAAADEAPVVVTPAEVIETPAPLEVAAVVRAAESVVVAAEPAVVPAPGEVPAVTLPVATAPVEAAAAVPLTDSISVAAELVQAGAMTLSEEEVQLLQRSRRQVILVSSALGGAILALLLVAILLVTSHVEPSPAPVVRPAAPAAVAAPPVAAPAMAAVVTDEELAPLPRLVVPVREATPVNAEAPRAPRAKQPAAPKASAGGASTPTPPEKVEAVTPERAEGFEFLNEAPEAAADLKRPSP